MSKSNAWRPFTFLANTYIVLMAVYLALFTDYNHLLPLKLISFYAFGGGFVALTLLLSLESIAIGMVKPKELLKKLAPSSAVQWCLLGYLVFSLVSALLSQYPQTWIGATRYEGFLTVAIYVGSFYFLAKFARPEKWMMYAFGAAATVFGVIAVLQLAGLPLLYADGMNYYSGGSINSADYLIGTIGNIDFSAALLALVFPVITLYVIKAREKYRFLLLVPALLSLYVLMRIWVLLGLAGLFAAVVLTFPYAIGLKKRGITVYFALLPVLALVAIGVLYAVPFQRGMLYELHSILHGEVQASFGTGRFHIWREVIERVPDNLFFGTGPDTMLFDSAIEPFTRVDAVEGLIVRRIDIAHNEFLNVLYHQGIFAFLCYFGAAVAFLISFFQNAHKNSPALIFGAGVIGYEAALMFGMTMPPIGAFFWLCLGLFECAVAKKEDAAEAPAKRKKHA